MASYARKTSRKTGASRTGAGIAPQQQGRCRMSSKSMKARCLATCASLVLLSAFATKALAEPEMVKGPPADPECMVPWSADTKLFKFPAKKGPYRIALANGYIANTWRIQM